ncbi:MAG TPA: AI-2E family transporter [Herpetosiphonaceae bacterium]|nr:AI-2E family transporter [Herpetosiphonaceae bacterium]
MLAQPNRPIQFSSRAKFVTVLSVVVIAIFLLGRVAHILLPFVWAIITAYIFNPVVTWMQRRTRTPRFWWVVLLYIIGFGLLYLFGTYIVPQLAKQYNELEEVLPTWIDNAQAYVAKYPTIEIRGVEIVDLREAETEIFDALKGVAAELPAFVPAFLFGLIEGFILTLVYFVVTFYLLLQAESIPNNFYGLIPSHHREEIKQLVHSIDRVLGAYIRGQFLLILIMSVLSFIALSILQVKYALVISILTGVLEIIPIVGPYLATGIASMVALLQGTTPFGWQPWFLAIVVMIVYFALRQFEDHFIIPNLVGHIVNVHPIFVIFAILAGGSLAGGLGLLVAIPIAAVIKIILVYLYSKLVDSPTPQEDISQGEDDLLDKPSTKAVEDKPAEAKGNGAPEAA